MLVLTALLLALIPAAAILYPYLRHARRPRPVEDESSPLAELSRRWDATLAGLKSVELERALGNLAEEDYRWLKQQHMIEGALVLKAMELEEEQELELLASVEREVHQVRLRALGTDGGKPLTSCPRCSSELGRNALQCPVCGEALTPAGAQARPDLGHSGKGNDE